MDCLFCKIINGEIPSTKVYEDDLVLAFLDIDQTKKGHTLVIPKKHLTDIYESDEKIIAHMFEVGKKIGQNIMKDNNKKALSFTINYGLYQEVKHLHLHICP